MKYNKYNLADRRTIEKIVPVNVWNEECHPDNKIKVKYGYVMPVYHGYVWDKSKQKLIDRFTY